MGQVYVRASKRARAYTRSAGSKFAKVASLLQKRPLTFVGGSLPASAKKQGHVGFGKRTMHPRIFKSWKSERRFGS